MPFDPGTNTFGFGWGSSYGGGNSAFGGRPRSNFNPSPLPRAGLPSVSAVSGGYGYNPTGPATAEAYWSNRNLGRDDDLWDQQMQERTLGLQHKYGMERLQAELEAQKWAQSMQLYAQGMALPTGEQIERSRGDLQGSLNDYQRYATEGRYNPEQMNTLAQDSWNQINTGARNNAMTMNNQLSALGLSANPGASAVLGMAGRFAANAQRGNVMAGLERENAQAKEWGVAGKAGINSQMADYASRPINRMANFDPWEMMAGGRKDPRQKKTARGPAYGSGTPWRPTPTGVAA